MRWRLEHNHFPFSNSRFLLERVVSHGPLIVNVDTEATVCGQVLRCRKTSLSIFLFWEDFQRKLGWNGFGYSMIPKLVLDYICRDTEFIC
jgi:hypothetical protein